MPDYAPQDSPTLSNQFQSATPVTTAAVFGRLWTMLAVGLTVCVLLIVSGIQPALSAEEYQLGPQDKVRLKIYEWRASRDAIFEWTALNDTFIVGADGTISLPFAGNVEANGLTAGKLARRIAERLKQNMGLGREPDVSVEVSQFRPFYIVGQVAQPGEFPYRPGLTVLQAISIAGGLKTRQDTVGRYEREIISGRSDVDLLRLSKINLMAKRARLQAEQAQASNIAFPQSFLQNQADKSVAAAMQQESAIFETRRKGQETQLKALAELAEFLKKEQESLTAHLAFQDRQLELYQKDLDGIATLVKKGFATESRQTALERSLVQARSDRLSAETSLLRAQQELSRTDLSVLEMKNRYDNEVRVSLRETQSQLEDIERRSETASRLLYDSELTAPRLANQNRKAAQSEPDYTIVRQSSGVNSQLKADENTPVRPGDTVKVEIPYIENNDGFDISTPDRAGTSSIGDTGPQLQSAQ